MTDMVAVLNNFANFRKTYIYTPNLETVKFANYRESIGSEDEEVWTTLDRENHSVYTFTTDSNYTVVSTDNSIHRYKKSRTVHKIYQGFTSIEIDGSRNKIAMSNICCEVYGGQSHCLRRTVNDTQDCLVFVSVMHRGKTFEESTFVTTIMFEKNVSDLLARSKKADAECESNVLERFSQ